MKDNLILALCVIGIFLIIILVEGDQSSIHWKQEKEEPVIKEKPEKIAKPSTEIPYEDPKAPFSDVSPTAWYAGYVATVYDDFNKPITVKKTAFEEFVDTVQNEIGQYRNANSSKARDKILSQVILELKDFVNKTYISGDRERMRKLFKKYIFDLLKVPDKERRKYEK